MRVAIVGQGYVGTALGLAAHQVGHEVIGIEVDPSKLRALKVESPYSISDQFQTVRETEVVIIAVPTPLNTDREPDLSHLKAACESIKPWLSSSTLIVNESTSYPGTLRNFIAPIFGGSYSFAAAPERIDPGNLDWHIGNTPRLVSGLTRDATRRALEFYRSFCSEIIEVSSPEVAEAAKLFENTFRQVNIALVNEFAQVSKALGISATETLRAANTKPYGFMSFLPSIGVGGHCIPVDPSYLSYVAEKAGADARFIKLANEVNLGMPQYVAERLDKEFGLKGKEVQIAGIAYKAGVSDTRESPALALIKLLRAKGATVTWVDKEVETFGNESSAELKPVDIGIICTAHPGVDYSPWKNGTVVIDVSTSKELGWPKYL